MRAALIIGKIICLLAIAGFFVSAALAVHSTQLDLGPVIRSLGASLDAATGELDSARQATIHFDSGIEYEVEQLRKPPSKAMVAIKAVAGVLGAFARA